MRAFVASDNRQLGERVRDFLSREGHECPAGHLLPISAAGSRLPQVVADVVVVVLSPDPEKAISALREVHDMSSARILAIGPIEDARLILSTQRAGADEYLDEREVEAELSNAFVRVLAAQTAVRRKRGRIIAMLACSGGCGVSTLASNVAAVLASQHGSAALVDLRLHANDLATMLDVQPSHTLADLCRNLKRLDRCMFEQLLVKHSTGVHLLAPPQSFEEIDCVSAEGVRRALLMARQVFPYVVVDLDSSLREEQVEAVHHANLVVMVVRLDFTALRNTRRTLQYLEGLGVEPERIRLVVNRYGQPKQLAPSKVEEVLGLKVAEYVPDDPKTINRATNRGALAVFDRPSARVSRSLVRLAMSVNGEA